MHTAAYDFLREQTRVCVPDFIEGKGLDLGGIVSVDAPRQLWPKLEWTVVNPHVQPGYGVARGGVKSHYVAEDARFFDTMGFYRLAICTEVFEHVENWEAICETASSALLPASYFFVTCAGPGRKPHNMHDGGELPPSEYYEYLLPHVLGTVLRGCGFRCKITYEPEEGDVYAIAIKR